MTHLRPALLGALLLVGCATPTATVANGRATLSVQPTVASGGYSAQATVARYTSASIEHLVVQLYRVDGVTEIPVVDAASNPVLKDIASDSLAVPVAFFNLHPQTTYRVRGYAYKATGTADADLISVNASSSADIVVATDDRPTMGALPILLKDTVFSGEATASTIDVTDGELVNVDEGIH